ncbi:MAG: enoyl-CoA hydratase/isomerase family protein [Acidobacteriota bacterium]|nr:enoyl-CoA hydratase/isomerase family protein [Acidobacteriota bacterium]MDH3530141.1 enoyl-CoA hydratase/isomerase family protein [Acidobacteriota bacterium]
MTQPPDKRPIEIESVRETRIIKFARPDLKNRLSVSVLEALEESFLECSADPACACIIITGSGDTFAAGANLAEVANLSNREALGFAQRGQRVFRTIRNATQKTVAAVNGYCMGGALDLALSCDKRIVSPAAVFAHPGVKLGIITGWGGTQLLPRLIGRKNAFHLFLTADRIDASEALRIGLADEVTKDPLRRSIEYCREGTCESF